MPLSSAVAPVLFGLVVDIQKRGKISPGHAAMNKYHTDLLSCCDIDTFTAGGKGGQHQNKTESAVRLHHRSTGIMVICRDERSQHLNKMRCLENLAQKLAKRTEKPAPRIPTKKSRAVKRRIFEIKKRSAHKKNLRKKPVIEE